MDDKVQFCSICQQPYTGYGNNAQPVNNGTCCDDCNSLVVIPARLARHRRGEPMRSVNPESDTTYK